VVESIMMLARLLIYSGEEGRSFDEKDLSASSSTDEKNSWLSGSDEN